MSVAEIKSEVARLPLADRLEIADLLAQQDRNDETARRARIARRMQSIDDGRKITLEQLASLHEAMKTVGL